MSTCPNTIPTHPTARRLAIIGECPSTDDVGWHVCTRCGHGFNPARSYTVACPNCRGEAVARPTPFTGPAGNLLRALLSEVGIRREDCFLGNVCQHPAPRGEFKFLKWESVEVQDGIKQLTADLATYQPHMILALGNAPLRLLRGEKSSVDSWRGSLFLATTGIKCLAAHHPRALLIDASLTAVTRFDMRRLADELRTNGLVLPARNIVIGCLESGFTADHIIDWCEVQRSLKTPLSFDIEGNCGYIECIGFATGPGFAFVIPFIHVDGHSVWSEDDEVLIWHAVAALLEDSSVPKIAQNALFDCFVLAWTLGIVVQGLRDDTMVKHHELYCELEKSLGFQTSIYTREPFYKFQRKRSKQMQLEADANTI